MGGGATLDGSNLSGGGITLGASSAQNLNGVGTVLSAGTGTTTINSGSSLSPGLGTNSFVGMIGTLTFGTSANGSNGNLTLNSGSTLNFVLGSPGNGSLIAVNGNLTLPVSGMVNLNVINNNDQGGLGSLSSGTYELFSYTGTLTNFNAASSFTQSVGGSTYTYTDQVNEPGSPNQIDVQVVANALTWTGQAGNTVTAPQWSGRILGHRRHRQLGKRRDHRPDVRQQCDRHVRRRLYRRLGREFQHPGGRRGRATGHRVFRQQ